MKWRKQVALTLGILLLAAALTGCMRSASNPEATPGATGSAAKPEIPSKLKLENGVPQLNVYNVDKKAVQGMDIESYVQGVLAGEMRADWPMEALKAQAILARTFTLKFISEKQSKYKGADISTDIKEAQAYDEAKINDRIIKAVDETRGQVLSYNGTFPYAWFHAHAGGQTELATKALDFEGQEPPYTVSVESPDSDRAPDTVKNWTATFTADEVGAAAEAAGTKTGAVKTIEIGEKGESGRAVTFKINGQDVSGPALRIKLDPMKLKSTKVSEVSVSGGKVTFTGSGYGHGVGMSQWGAYGMAEQGAKAQDIVMHYFKNVSVVKPSGSSAC
jgi:stage II sporulation protein D